MAETELETENAGNTGDNDQTGAGDKTEDKTESISRKETSYVDLEEQYGPIYDGSVYHDLVFYKQTNSKSALLFGILTIVAQLYMYSTFIAEAAELTKNDEYPVVQAFLDCNGKVTSDKIETLTCDDGTSSGGSFSFFILPALLIAAFTYGDLLCSIKIFQLEDIGKFAKVVAGLIIIVTIMALVSASMFAYLGYYQGSLFDAIVNCVGVLFVNDIDEKLYEAIQYIDKDKLFCCWKKGCCRTHSKVTLFIIWFSIAITFIVVQDNV